MFTSVYLVLLLAGYFAQENLTVKPVSYEHTRCELLTMKFLMPTEMDQLALVLQNVLNLSILHNKILYGLKHGKFRPLYQDIR